MMFDSHVAALLDAAVALVNVLTNGAKGGKPYTAPRGDDLPRAVAAALPSTQESQIGPEEAVYLSRTAQRMRTVFEAVEHGRIGDAAGTVNELLRSTGARPQLDLVAGEPWQVHFHGASDSLDVGWSAGCATALALAIGSDLAGRLGICQAPRCDRVFIDSSRNAARQFCSTNCQSRVKAAAFRARQAERR
ncbi:CGNR zinc finger domain-containing protein [Actinomadura sp. 7K534]|uniref:CGNR zinc finger domain-containing protein n=1 Tax=Actinomadura sp. 7K534 TaxID=2530366 RepID=UPI00104D4E2D|nr:CGNR zinc finger domain-containing protein [Actinomadura sp. 7K534]TDB89233.1 CGNR zinc finger domain-containing protein [Actinomadura sp. 7K534]